AAWLLLFTALIPFWEPHAVTQMLLFDNLWFIPFLAPLIGCVLGKTDVWDRQFRLTTFTATRPVTSGDYVAVKLRMAALSLLLSWGLLALFTPLWLVIAGNHAELVRWCRAFLHAHPGVLDVQARDLWVEGESGVKGPLLVVLAVVGLFG